MGSHQPQLDLQVPGPQPSSQGSLHGETHFLYILLLTPLSLTICILITCRFHSPLFILHVAISRLFPTAARPSTLGEFLEFFLSIKCFQKQNFRKSVQLS